jgi:PAS domain S-box-containing protein
MKSEETIIELFGKMPYKPLVEEIKDYAICHLDIEGRILSWNQGAQLIFGYGKDEIIGQHFAIIFTPEDRAQLAPEQELSTAKETGRAEDTRWHLRKDNSLFFAHGVTSALRDETGKLIGYAKIARDDTPRKQMEEACSKARKNTALLRRRLRTQSSALTRKAPYFHKPGSKTNLRLRDRRDGRSIAYHANAGVSASYSHSRTETLS